MSTTVPSAGATIACGSSGIRRGGSRKKLMSHDERISGTKPTQAPRLPKEQADKDGDDERPAKQIEIVPTPTGDGQFFEHALISM